MPDLHNLNPLEFQSRQCKKSFKYPEDLDVLNNLPNLVIIYDLWEKNNAKRLWANAAWLAEYHS
eukprot:2450260-Rhodomonas_salina.1